MLNYVWVEANCVGFLSYKENPILNDGLMVITRYNPIAVQLLLLSHAALQWTQIIEFFEIQNHKTLERCFIAYR